MEKKSFISLLYAILDVRDGRGISLGGVIVASVYFGWRNKYLRPDEGRSPGQIAALSSFMKEKTLLAPVRRQLWVFVLSDGVTKRAIPSMVNSITTGSHPLPQACRAAARGNVETIQRSVKEFTEKQKPTMTSWRWSSFDGRVIKQHPDYPKKSASVKMKENNHERI